MAQTGTVVRLQIVQNKHSQLLMILYSTLRGQLGWSPQDAKSFYWMMVQPDDNAEAVTHMIVFVYGTYKTVQEQLAASAQPRVVNHHSCKAFVNIYSSPNTTMSSAMTSVPMLACLCTHVALFNRTGLCFRVLTIV